MAGHRKFADLRAKMSPEAQARSQAKAVAMLAALEGEALAAAQDAQDARERDDAPRPGRAEAE